VVARVNQNADRVHSLHAEIRLLSPDLAQSRLTRAVVDFAEPHRYRVKFTALFGATVALLLVNDEQVDLYVPLTNRIYQGQMDAEQVKLLVGIELDPAELMEALLGTIRLPPASELLDYRPIVDGHRLVFSCPGGRQEVQVASDGLRVQRLSVFDDEGRCLLTKTFHDHRLIGDVVRPGSQQVSVLGRSDPLEVIFVEQELNLPLGEEIFHLDFPESVERIELNPE
jgi:hypothetical protein